MDSQVLIKPRKPFVAFILAALFGSVGLAYVGRMTLGLVVFFSMLAIYLGVAAGYGYGVLSYNQTIVSVFAAAPIMYFGTIFLAVFYAAKDKTYQLKAYNSLFFYLLFTVLVAVVSGAAMLVQKRFFTEVFYVTNSALPKSAPLGSCAFVRKPKGHHAQINQLVVWRHGKSFYIGKITATPEQPKVFMTDNNHYFVEAEEPGHMDSNAVGPISREDIYGIVADVVEPQFKTGFLSHVSVFHCFGETRN